MPDEATARRKDAHLDLCAAGEVEPAQNSSLFECVRLVHCALPELALDDVELDVSFLGKKLKVPLMITGMTGGTERALQVNRDLALLAERHGLAFGVGSQRAMSEEAGSVAGTGIRSESFKVRSVAPTALIVGNIGAWQAERLGLDGVKRLADEIGADAMAVHLNPAQELTQPEGDRDFKGGYRAIERLSKVFPGRLLVKETGCGISPAVARRLREMGVTAIDVSGLGGTSWVRVEQLRAEGPMAELGAQFSGWGIPTAAAVASVRKAVGPSLSLVASGGVRTGLEMAKALALGGDIAGLALPLFRAQQEGGVARAEAVLHTLVAGLKQALLLTGSRNVAELRTKPSVITGELKEWIAALG